MSIQDLLDHTWYRGANESPGWLYLGEGNNTTEQFGPGLYFSDKYETAQSYGRVKKFRIKKLKSMQGNDIRFFSNKTIIASGYICPEEAKKLVWEFMGLMEEDSYLTVLSNWHENRRKAELQLFNAIYYTAVTMTDLLQNIWAELFMSKATDFLLCCRALHIGGLIFVDPYETNYSTETFLVLYDPLLVREIESDFSYLQEQDSSWRM